MSDTPTVEAIIKRLRPLARPNALEGMARLGIATESALGVSMPDLRAMGKPLVRNKDAILSPLGMSSTDPDANPARDSQDENRNQDG